MGKVAFITGITGQDGAYLAEFLLARGYQVVGLVRRTSTVNFERIRHIQKRLMLVSGDLLDQASLINVVQRTQPDEVYNLAAQSHVAVSFETPEYTADSVGLGTLRLLDAIRILGLEDKTRFYQASTSELYGKVQEVPQTERTPFYPRSPYAAAKLYSYWITVNYREAYGIFASNGILFNHESEQRGETFVTRKITRAAARIAVGLEETLFLGNLDAKRDWGYAPEYVEGMWRILQHDRPDDFVLATGETHAVRELVEHAFAAVELPIEWRGEGVDEVGVVAGSERVVVRIDPRYFRPTDVELLIGDPTKAREELGWRPQTTFVSLVRRMVASDLEEARREVHMNSYGGEG